MKTCNRELDLLNLARRSGLINNEQHVELEHLLPECDNVAELLHEYVHIDRSRIRALLDYQRRHSIPSNIGGYRIAKEIGRGGMGIVYQAYRKHQPSDMVAIKVLSPKKLCHSITTARFLREIKVAQSIRHPYLVSCLDTGMIEGKPYLVLEYMENGDLSQANVVDERIAVQAIANCARAVQAIADAGWVHRDIKPGNILLTKDGVAKLADFGLAKTTDNDPAQALTQQGCFVGTPAYTAPELLGAGEANVRSDIYALGATLYHLLSGDPPYRSSDPRGILRAIRNGKPPFPLSVACSPACRYIVSRAMAPKPEDRYENADAMAEDCELMLAGKHPLNQPSRNFFITCYRSWINKTRKMLHTVIKGREAAVTEQEIPL